MRRGTCSSQTTSISGSGEWTMRRRLSRRWLGTARPDLAETAARPPARKSMVQLPPPWTVSEICTSPTTAISGSGGWITRPPLSRRWRGTARPGLAGTPSEFCDLRDDAGGGDRDAAGGKGKAGGVEQDAGGFEDVRQVEERLALPPHDGGEAGTPPAGVGFAGGGER